MFKKAVFIVLSMVTLVQVMSREARAAILLNIKVTNQVIVEIPCSGDVVALSGRIHVLFTDTGKAQIQPQDMSGVVIAGPNLGAKYTGTGVTQRTDSDGGNSEQTTFVNRFDFHGQGQAPDFSTHETIRFTLVDGEVKTELLNVKITCK